jgi:hypothetical protein
MQIDLGYLKSLLEAFAAAPGPLTAIDRRTAGVGNSQGDAIPVAFPSLAPGCLIWGHSITHPSPTPADQN